MKQVHFTKRFKKDLKKVLSQGRLYEDFEAIVDQLTQNQTLDKSYKPHKLSGEYSQFWECHIKPDWLLIYKFDTSNLWLVRTGSHSELFRKY